MEVVFYHSSQPSVLCIMLEVFQPARGEGTVMGRFGVAYDHRHTQGPVEKKKEPRLLSNQGHVTGPWVSWGKGMVRYPTKHHGTLRVEGLDGECNSPSEVGLEPPWELSFVILIWGVTPVGSRVTRD